MSFSSGSDLLSAVLVATVFSVFVVALLQTYHSYAERRASFEHFGTALDLAEQVRDRASSSTTPGSLGQWLDGRARTMAREGLSFRVEVRDFRGDLLFSHGQAPDALASYLSPAAGVGLPIAFSPDGISSGPCELSVQVWGG